MNYNGNIVLNANASAEIRNVYIERIDTTAETALVASLTAAHTGRIIFNTTDKVYKFWNGTAFAALGSGSGNADAVQAELDRLELSLGNFINSDGSFTPTALDALLNVDISSATSLVDVLVALDAAIANIDVSGQLTPLQNEINAIETGAGLGTDGTYTANGAANYISTATSLKDADDKLDAALKTLADTQVDDKAELQGEITLVQTSVTGLQTEVDAIETGAGLGTDGTYTANGSSNYLTTATSLKDADNKLDAAIKVNADAIAALDTVVDGKQDALGFVPVNKAGDSVNGNLTFGGTSTLKNLAAPVDPSDAIRKIDLENALAGAALDFQADVLGVETDFVDVPGRYIYVDGSRFTIGVAAEANDIVVVDADGNITAVAYDVSVQGPGALAWNRAAGQWFSWNGTTWSAFGGMDGVTAGVGLEKVANVLNVKLGAGIADLPTGEVGLDLKLNGGLELVDPTAGTASTASDAVLAVKAAGSLEVTASGVDVKDAGITATELAASVAGNGLDGGAGTALSVQPVTDGYITVGASGVDVDITKLDAKYIAKAGGTMTGDLVLAGDANAPLEAVTLQQMQAGDAANATAITNLETAVNGKITQVVASLNKTSYVHSYTTTGATAAISVVHNLGVKYCVVTVVDETDEVIVPQSIKFIDTNTLEVTLNTDITGKVVVAGHATLTLA